MKTAWLGVVLGAAGLRTGFSATSWNDNFWQREAFAPHNHRWRWHLDSDMSNAGISEHNPGLDLHMIALSYHC